MRRHIFRQANINSLEKLTTSIFSEEEREKEMTYCEIQIYEKIYNNMQPTEISKGNCYKKKRLIKNT
jgi:hypothetical protein